jgi:hypothetical protein
MWCHSWRIMTTMIYTKVAKGYGFKVLVWKGCCCCLSIVIQLLSYHIVIHWSTLMGRFGVDVNYVIKKVQKIKDYCYFLCYIYVWRMVRKMEPDRGTRLQEMSGLNMFFNLFFSNCQMLWCFVARHQWISRWMFIRCEWHFVAFKNFVALELVTEY